MPDLGSQVLDVVIALAFVYFLLSTFGSAITETISWILHRRAGDLEKGLRALLADEKTAEQVLEHPLVKQFSPTGIRARLLGRKTPAYLSARNFSLALLDTLAPPPANQTGSRDVLKALRKSVNTLPDALKRQLSPVLDGLEGDIKGVRASIETWFDDAMSRASGWYKRWAQLWICIAALIVTVAFNVDTLRLANRLWNDDALRESTAGAAAQLADPDEATAAPGAAPQGSSSEDAEAILSASSEDVCKFPAPTSSETGQSVDDSVAQARRVTSCVKDLQLPVGWSEANDNVTGSTLIGWLITFLAVSLGAPFWFDTLSRIARLRTTGPKPGTGVDEPGTRE
jgi:hypothetical protein